MSPQAARIHAALPQTQCTRCGYPDCAGYAQAIGAGDAPINQCPPGGAEGIQRLSEITGLPPLALNPANGSEAARAVAVIDEAWCIGCTLCLDACPTDAIIGSNKFMHTVVERYCTGCELCVPVCPVDCISLEVVTANRTGWQAWSTAEAAQALARYEARQRRKAREQPGQEEHSATRVNSSTEQEPASAGSDLKRKMIESAVARARAKRGEPTRD